MIGCRTVSYNPSTVPVEQWFSQKNSTRKPKVTKPKETAYSGKVNLVMLERSKSAPASIVIDIGAQKGYLLVGGKIAASCPVSTAKPGKHTPRGTYYVTERVRTGKVSTIYNVTMPYWMRLGDSPIGLHAGYVPGYPASAGCIRMPHDMARLFYDNTRSGTKVTIYSSWSGG
jgi:lipoprotein-anchoring transpeptidase ErfK/SrfK